MKFRETRENISGTGYPEPKIYIGEYAGSTPEDIASDLTHIFRSLEQAFPATKLYRNAYEFELRLNGEPITEAALWRRVLDLPDGMELLAEFCDALWNSLKLRPDWIMQQMEDGECDAAGMIPIRQALEKIDSYDGALSFFDLFWRFLSEVADMDLEVNADWCIRKMLDLLDVGPRMHNEQFLQLLLFRLVEGQLAYNVQEIDFYDKYMGPFESPDRITMPGIVERLRDDPDWHFCIPQMIYYFYGRKHLSCATEVLEQLAAEGYEFDPYDLDTGFFDDRLEREKIQHRDAMIEASQVPLYTGYHIYDPDTKFWSRDSTDYLASGAHTKP
ncbi:MAG: hypothetical protein AAF993_14190 [Pseudomonadota bacterium]